MSVVRLRVARGSDPGSSTPLAGAVDRFARAVHRFHEKVAVIPDRALRRELGLVGETLDSCLADLQQVCRRGVRRGREDVVLAACRRAATLCSHATETALMASERARHREFEDLVRCVDTTWTLTKAVRELVDTCMLYE